MAKYGPKTRDAWDDADDLIKSLVHSMGVLKSKKDAKNMALLSEAFRSDTADKNRLSIAATATANREATAETAAKRLAFDEKKLVAEIDQKRSADMLDFINRSVTSGNSPEATLEALTNVYGSTHVKSFSLEQQKLSQQAQFARESKDKFVSFLGDNADNAALTSAVSNIYGQTNVFNPEAAKAVAAEHQTNVNNSAAMMSARLNQQKQHLTRVAGINTATNKMYEQAISLGNVDMGNEILELGRAYANDPQGFTQNRESFERYNYLIADANAMAKSSDAAKDYYNKINGLKSKFAAVTAATGIELDFQPYQFVTAPDAEGNTTSLDNERNIGVTLDNWTAAVKASEKFSIEKLGKVFGLGGDE